MCKKYKKINRLLLVLPLMTFMTSCSDWGYNHESSNPIALDYDHPRWDEQGFTLEEYRIYKSGKMNNREHNPDSAIPWKKAGIPAVYAVQYHQQGKKMDIDDKTAIYLAERNISLDEYMQVKNALNNYSNAKDIVHNREDETKIIQYIKTGLSSDNAILKLKQDQKNEEIAEEKRIWGEENYKKCKSFSKEMDIGMDGPDGSIGRCYLLFLDFMQKNGYHRNRYCYNCSLFCERDLLVFTIRERFILNLIKKFKSSSVRWQLLVSNQDFINMKSQ